MSLVDFCFQKINIQITFTLLKYSEILQMRSQIRKKLHLQDKSK